MHNPASCLEHLAVPAASTGVRVGPVRPPLLSCRGCQPAAAGAVPWPPPATGRCVRTSASIGVSVGDPADPDPLEATRSRGVSTGCGGPSVARGAGHAVPKAGVAVAVATRSEEALVGDASEDAVTSPCRRRFRWRLRLPAASGSSSDASVLCNLGPGRAGGAAIADMPVVATAGGLRAAPTTLGVVEAGAIIILATLAAGCSANSVLAGFVCWATSRALVSHFSFFPSVSP